MNTGSTGERVKRVRIKEGWRKMTPGKQESKLEKWNANKVEILHKTHML